MCRTPNLHMCHMEGAFSVQDIQFIYMSHGGSIQCAGHLIYNVSHGGSIQCAGPLIYICVTWREHSVCRTPNLHMRHMEGAFSVQDIQFIYMSHGGSIQCAGHLIYNASHGGSIQCAGHLIYICVTWREHSVCRTPNLHMRHMEGAFSVQDT